MYGEWWLPGRSENIFHISFFISHLVIGAEPIIWKESLNRRSVVSTKRGERWVREIRLRREGLNQSSGNERAAGSAKPAAHLMLFWVDSCLNHPRSLIARPQQENIPRQRQSL